MGPVEPGAGQGRDAEGRVPGGDGDGGGERAASCPAEAAWKICGARGGGAGGARSWVLSPGDHGGGALAPEAGAGRGWKGEERSGPPSGAASRASPRTATGSLGSPPDSVSQSPWRDSPLSLPRR